MFHKNTPREPSETQENMLCHDLDEILEVKLIYSDRLWPRMRWGGAGWRKGPLSLPGGMEMLCISIGTAVP